MDCLHCDETLKVSECRVGRIRDHVVSERGLPGEIGMDNSKKFASQRTRGHDSQ